MKISPDPVEIRQHMSNAGIANTWEDTPGDSANASSAGGWPAAGGAFSRTGDGGMNGITQDFAQGMHFSGVDGPTTPAPVQVPKLDEFLKERISKPADRQVLLQFEYDMEGLLNDSTYVWCFVAQ